MKTLIDFNKPAHPVECCGMTFSSEETRREHFLNLLAEKLKDNEFRKLEGFPFGSDEEILALSDPPYYTACPNPFVAEVVRANRDAVHALSDYKKEPFAADVSEGKNDPIYFAHSYHTKVPHKAIMRYILHYTQPGDVVVDGFCGSGMTGVAAQLCNDTSVVESLGYKVDSNGTILARVRDGDAETWKAFSKIGTRKSILSDLSPVATFIANIYNSPVDPEVFDSDATDNLAEISAKFGWMYTTLHSPTEAQLAEAVSAIKSSKAIDLSKIGPTGQINYVAWSDVFACPECAGEVVFWDCAVEIGSGNVLNEFPCPHCSALLGKRNLERLWTTKFDKAISQSIRQAIQRPVYISYKVGNRRYGKKPDAADLALLERIDEIEPAYAFPKSPLPDGHNTRQPIESHGFTHTHHFYTRRNLLCLSEFRARQGNLTTPNLTSTAIVASKMYRFRSQNGSLGAGGGPMNGTLYVPSLIKEIPVPKLLVEHIKKTTDLKRAMSHDRSVIVSTGSMTSLPNIENGIADYIFLDPPFGGNIMYSELNFLWEDWLGVRTNNGKEAIQNSKQNKGVTEYRKLMTSSFKEAYRILKPGRWLTVEFSNTQAAVWNAIQTALQEAGFVVANISMLDKKQGSFKAVTTTTAVKQDLVISAYKPNGGLEERFSKQGGTDETVWDFVRTHLGYLPTVKLLRGELEFVAERQPRIIFDRMVAWFVRHNTPVPLSSQEFQEGLRQRFDERDGMVFLPEQVGEYDRKREQATGAPQMELFVADERSAIDWLAEFLRKRPSTYQEVHPEFTTQLGAGWKKYEAKPELAALLADNFFRYDGDGAVPSQIHGYLSSNYKDLRGLEKSDPSLVAKAKDRWYVPDPNKAQDLEQKRDRALLKEFQAYEAVPGRRLKEFRLEVLRAGFKNAWAARNYKTILTIAQKIPEEALQEDEKLLLWYDQALTRMEAGA